MRIRSKYQIAGLMVLVLAVYYNAIFGGINSVDDSRILERYGVNGYLTLKDILVPGNGFYYRPLIELTYFLDYRFWGLDKSFMHLENIVFHACNTLLVYLIARRVAKFQQQNLSVFPFLSAALFALHPINTEAVSWIAGRTDPLAAVFVLIATLCLLIYLENNNLAALLASLTACALGSLAKETAILFLPMGLFFLLRWPPVFKTKSTTLLPRKTGIFIILGTMVGGAGLILLHLLGKSEGEAFAMVFDASNWGGAGSALFVGLKALGFYAKKLFIPFPQNFAISSVDDAYAVLAIPVLALVAFAARRISIGSFFVVASFLFILPAVLVSVAGITWTPVAERYLYLPAAFFSLSFVSYGMLMLQKMKRPHLAVPVFSMLILPAGVAVAQRNTVWHDNLSLYRDTVRKSPDFAPARNALANALIEAGRVEEGRAELRTARTLQQGNAGYLIDMNLLLQNLAALPREEAREELLPLVKDRKKADPNVLKMMADVDEERLGGERDTAKKREIAAEIIEINDARYLRKPDPFLLYRNGQLLLMLENRRRAIEYFRRAADTAHDEDFFKAAAERLCARLSKE